jgi:hypothetical protein
LISPTLDILFEDEALIFINKPAGVVVQQRMHHPDERYLHADVPRHTSPAYLMQRLDRGTSGVMFYEPLRVTAPLPDDFLEEADRRGLVIGERCA